MRIFLQGGHIAQQGTVWGCGVKMGRYMDAQEWGDVQL